jgi:hypothetical protein
MVNIMKQISNRYKVVMKKYLKKEREIFFKYQQISFSDIFKIFIDRKCVRLISEKEYDITLTYPNNKNK